MDVKDRKNYYREYARKRIKERRAYILAALGGKCASCESTDNLEVDHVDADTKTFKIASSWSYSLERVNAELSKCQLLCDSCHNIKSRIDIGNKNRGKTYTTLFLNLETIEDIRRKYLTERQYVAKYGISRTVIRRIQSGDWQRYLK